MELLDQHINESPQVLVELVPLRLGDLEELGHVEEELRLLVVGEVLTLVQEEDHLVQEVDALFLLEGLVVKDIGLLDESTLVQA